MDDDLKKLIESTAVETRRHFDVVAERLETKMDALASDLQARVERLESSTH